MKNARAEKVTLKRELHGLLKPKRSVLPTIKISVRRKEAIIAILPSHTELSSDVVTIFNQKYGKGTL